MKPTVTIEFEEYQDLLEKQDELAAWKKGVDDNGEHLIILKESYRGVVTLYTKEKALEQISKKFEEQKNLIYSLTIENEEHIAHHRRYKFSPGAFDALQAYTKWPWIFRVFTNTKKYINECIQKYGVHQG
jgi:hypothetical protein